MAGGIGLGRMMQGAVEGLDKTEARRDRETQRGREDTQWEQGQEDRDYKLQRQGITDTREDEQYKIAKDKQDRFRNGGEALRGWMGTGDLDGINEYLNKYTADGISYDISKSEDGTYSSIMSVDGKAADPKIITDDEIGTHMQMVMAQDPFAAFESKLKKESDTKAKGTDRKHDMAKLEKEYELKRGLEHIKGKYKKGGTTSDRRKTNLSISKELNDLAKEDYGSLFGDQWKFDTTRDKTMRAAQADLASALYFSSDDPEPDTNKASRTALQEMRKFLTSATEQADTELDEGTIDKKQYDNRVADIIEFHTDNAINKMAPAPGQSLQRGGVEESEYMTDNNTPVPLEAIQQLKDDDSDEAKKEFDEWFKTPGLADKILSGGQIGEGKTANAGVSGEGSPSLIREANASEAKPAAKEKEEPKLAREKKDFSGQKKRKEGRKSQKAHRQIAVSEYKHDWANMDDDEKTEWFAENAQALKAASPRSHRKANKEITAIRRKERFSKKGKEEYKLMREERKK